MIKELLLLLLLLLLFLMFGYHVVLLFGAD